MGIENRGFAGMTPSRRHELCSRGGKAAHKKGTAHQWTSEEAKEAGKKGAKARLANRAKPLGLEGE